MYILTEDNNQAKRLSDNAFIPFDPANTDYRRFKAEIEAGAVELQGIEGGPVSPEEAKDFVKELP